MQRTCLRTRQASIYPASQYCEAACLEAVALRPGLITPAGCVDDFAEEKKTTHAAQALCGSLQALTAQAPLRDLLGRHDCCLLFGKLKECSHVSSDADSVL